MVILNIPRLHTNLTSKKVSMMNQFFEHLDSRNVFRSFSFKIYKSKQTNYNWNRTKFRYISTKLSVIIFNQDRTGLCTTF